MHTPCHGRHHHHETQRGCDGYRVPRSASSFLHTPLTHVSAAITRQAVIPLFNAALSTAPHHAQTHHAMNPSHQLPLHLQPQALHLSAIPQGLQNLDGLPSEANDAFFQQRYAHHLGGPSAHTLHFQGHGGALQQVGGHSPFPPFSGGYPRTFELSAPPPQQQQQQQQHHHIQGPPPQQVRPQVQQSPMQRVPQQVSGLEAQNEFLQNQPQAPGQIQVPEVDDAPVTNHGQFEGLRLIPDPPDLDLWREKLFHVDDTITLTEDEYVWRDARDQLPQT